MARTPDSRPTLDAVAALAGVSKATASKVLNGRPGSSEATRERVERAMAEVGYTPLSRERPGRGPVHVVFDTLVNLYSMKVLEGLVAASRGAGVDLVTTVLRVPGDGQEPLVLDRAWVQSITSRGHQGVVLVTTRVEPWLVAACRESGLALVAVDPPSGPNASAASLDASFASIGSNHFAGGLQATEHLIALGHRRIGFVSGHPAGADERERFGGYRDALAAAGIVDDSELIGEPLGAWPVDAAPSSLHAAEQETARLLALADPPTAVFATNDGAAFGAIRAVVARGLRVPDDVSVIGYDDTYSAMPMPTTLSTIRTPMREIGRLAVETVLRLASGTAPSSHHVKLATSLVARESTAPRRP